MSRLGGLAPARPTSGMPDERERTPPVVLNVVTSTYPHVTVLCTALVIYNAVVVLDDACVIANELRWTTVNEHTHSRDIVPHSRDIYTFLI